MVALWCPKLIRYVFRGPKKPSRMLNILASTPKKKCDPHSLSVSSYQYNAIILVTSARFGRPSVA